jgi:methylmalonyl-CoA mutase N-terminal domain/subunit
MEKAAFDYFEKLDAMGGMVRAIEHGFPQKEIAEASYAYQKAVEAHEKIIVGVNEYAIDEAAPEILYIGESVREAQTIKLRRLRQQRSNDAVARSLLALSRAAEKDPSPVKNGISPANTMPYLLDCVKAYATIGEISNALKRVMGTYEEVGVA